ncbi:YveK family protein [Geodermatophilus sp. SYSU D01186]
MELQDYAVALRRHWAAALGVTLACVLAALVVVLATPAGYRATAQVFVASTGEGTSGSQFVNQRVTSYPDVARSRAVLGPVIEDLGLTGSFADLRARVEAVNPPDTSQIDIAVTGHDATEATEVANAIAEEFRVVVEDLERPEGGVSPVDLTVTNPATVPSSPDSPQTTLLLGLGLAVGLALGAALAVVRSRMDTTVHGPDDVRAAWGDGDLPPLLTRPSGHARRSALIGRPAARLARRIEALTEDRPVRVLLLSPSPSPALVPGAFADEVAQELRARGVATIVTGPSEDPTRLPAVPREGSARVRLVLGSSLLSLRTWKQVAEEFDGVVPVVAPGRVERAELAELRSILAGAGVAALAVVVSAVRRRRPASASGAAAAAKVADGAAEPLTVAR